MRIFTRTKRGQTVSTAHKEETRLVVSIPLELVKQGQPEPTGPITKQMSVRDMHVGQSGYIISLGIHVTKKGEMKIARTTNAYVGTYGGSDGKITRLEDGFQLDLSGVPEKSRSDWTYTPPTQYNFPDDIPIVELILW